MVEANCCLKNNTPKTVTFISNISCLLFLRLGNTMLAVVVKLLHKAFHFCVLKHYVFLLRIWSLECISVRLQHSFPTLQKTQHTHYKVQLINCEHANN